MFLRVTLQLNRLSLVKLVLNSRKNHVLQTIGFHVIQQRNFAQLFYSEHMRWSKFNRVFFLPKSQKVCYIRFLAVLKVNVESKDTLRERSLVKLQPKVFSRSQQSWFMVLCYNTGVRASRKKNKKTMTSHPSPNYHRLKKLQRLNVKSKFFFQH